jgi:acetate---CoA ligase (ADP-forming)
MIETSKPDRNLGAVSRSFITKDNDRATEPSTSGRWIPHLTRAGWEAIANPRRIALVGASGQKNSVSFTSRLLETNSDLGFTGDIFLINPSRSEIMGRKCWPSLSALPEPVDIVAINLPDEKVLSAVEEAIAHGARALMIHSGGFLERGAAGAERQKRLQCLCAEAHIPALGPNCLGFLSFTNRVSISSFKISAGSAPGSIAVISQSGSVASLLQRIVGRHGLSFLASTGNEAVTSAEDLMAYAIEDPTTRLIAAFVEGFRNPPALFELAERAHEAEKPVILLKAGLTQHGGAVSRSHTGAVAGSGAIYRQALRQANLVLVDDFDELAQTLELAATWRARPTSLRLGLLGTSGGELATLTDQCEEHGVRLPAFAARTITALQGVLHLPDDVWPRNPVDVGIGFTVPGPYQDRMRAAIRAVAADPSVDVVGVLQGFDRDSRDLSDSLNREILGAAAKESSQIGKPILVMASRTGAADEEVLQEVRAANIPALEGSREALRAIHHLASYAEGLVRRKARPHRPDSWEPLEGLSATLGDRDGSIQQADLFELLARVGLPAPPMVRLTSKAQAERAARDLGPRVVMKIDTARAVHKSDAGGVALDVTPETAAATYDRLLACLDPPVGTFPGEGVVVAAQIDGGVEVLVGVKRDEAFGLAVVLGLGGRLVEILDRTAILVPPFDEQDVREALERSGVGRFLDGFRGGPQADFDKLAELVVRVGRLAAALGNRLETFELNPVIINAQRPGGVIADARLLLIPELRP